ncbi:MAG: hypothetical protein CMI76_04115 [Candidatus Pelagibacter sp.]|nr:hypothetical protein [Candidatus Pelagibacter sp.]OUW70040.1 MAG: hypothetical protein CBD71_04465 [Rickettsiales bacterium TMED211]
MLEALRKKYEGDIAVARANVQVYINNASGIGEHPDVVQAVDEQMELIADAQDKLNVLDQWDNGTQRFID